MTTSSTALLGALATILFLESVRHCLCAVADDGQLSCAELSAAACGTAPSCVLLSSARGLECVPRCAHQESAGHCVTDSMCTWLDAGILLIESDATPGRGLCVPQHCGNTSNATLDTGSAAAAAAAESLARCLLADADGREAVKGSVVANSSCARLSEVGCAVAAVVASRVECAWVTSWVACVTRARGDALLPNEPQFLLPFGTFFFPNISSISAVRSGTLWIALPRTAQVLAIPPLTSATQQSSSVAGEPFVLDAATFSSAPVTGGLDGGAAAAAADTKITGRPSPFEESRVRSEPRRGVLQIQRVAEQELLVVESGGKTVSYLSVATTIAEPKTEVIASSMTIFSLAAVPFRVLQVHWLAHFASGQHVFAIIAADSNAPAALGETGVRAGYVATIGGFSIDAVIGFFGDRESVEEATTEVDRRLSSLTSSMSRSSLSRQSSPTISSSTQTVPNATEQGSESVSRSSAALSPTGSGERSLSTSATIASPSDSVAPISATGASMSRTRSAYITTTRTRSQSQLRCPVSWDDAETGASISHRSPLDPVAMAHGPGGAWRDGSLFVLDRGTEMLVQVRLARVLSESRVFPLLGAGSGAGGRTATRTPSGPEPTMGVAARHVALRQPSSLTATTATAPNDLLLFVGDLAGIWRFRLSTLRAQIIFSTGASTLDEIRQLEILPTELTESLYVLGRKQPLTTTTTTISSSSSDVVLVVALDAEREQEAVDAGGEAGDGTLPDLNATFAFRRGFACFVHYCPTLHSRGEFCATSGAGNNQDIPPDTHIATVLDIDPFIQPNDTLAPPRLMPQVATSTTGFSDRFYVSAFGLVREVQLGAGNGSLVRAVLGERATTQSYWECPAWGPGASLPNDRANAHRRFNAIAAVAVAAAFPSNTTVHFVAERSTGSNFSSIFAFSEATGALNLLLSSHSLQLGCVVGSRAPSLRRGDFDPSWQIDGLLYHQRYDHLFIAFHRNLAAAASIESGAAGEGGAGVLVVDCVAATQSCRGDVRALDALLASADAVPDGNPTRIIKTVGRFVGAVAQMSLLSWQARDDLLALAIGPVVFAQQLLPDYDLSRAPPLDGVVLFQIPAGAGEGTSTKITGMAIAPGHPAGSIATTTTIYLAATSAGVRSQLFEVTFDITVFPPTSRLVRLLEVGSPACDVAFGTIALLGGSEFGVSSQGAMTLVISGTTPAAPAGRIWAVAFPPSPRAPANSTTPSFDVSLGLPWQAPRCLSLVLRNATLVAQSPSESGFAGAAVLGPGSKGGAVPILVARGRGGVGILNYVIDGSLQSGERSVCSDAQEEAAAEAPRPDGPSVALAVPLDTGARMRIVVADARASTLSVWTRGDVGCNSTANAGCSQASSWMVERALFGLAHFASPWPDASLLVGRAWERHSGHPGRQWPMPGPPLAMLYIPCNVMAGHVLVVFGGPAPTLVLLSVAHGNWSEVVLSPNVPPLEAASSLSLDAELSEVTVADPRSEQVASLLLRSHPPSYGHAMAVQARRLSGPGAAGDVQRATTTSTTATPTFSVTDTFPSRTASLAAASASAKQPCPVAGGAIECNLATHFIARPQLVLVTAAWRSARRSGSRTLFVVGPAGDEEGVGGLALWRLALESDGSSSVATLLAPTITASFSLAPHSLRSLQLVEGSQELLIVGSSGLVIAPLAMRHPPALEGDTFVALERVCAAPQTETIVPAIPLSPTLTPSPTHSPTVSGTRTESLPLPPGREPTIEIAGEAQQMMRIFEVRHFNVTVRFDDAPQRPSRVMLSIRVSTLAVRFVEFSTAQCVLSPTSASVLSCFNDVAAPSAAQRASKWTAVIAIMPTRDLEDLTLSSTAELQTRDASTYDRLEASLLLRVLVPAHSIHRTVPPNLASLSWGADVTLFGSAFDTAPAIAFLGPFLLPLTVMTSSEARLRLPPPPGASVSNVIPRPCSAYASEALFLSALIQAQPTADTRLAAPVFFPASTISRLCALSELYLRLEPRQFLLHLGSDATMLIAPNALLEECDAAPLVQFHRVRWLCNMSYEAASPLAFQPTFGVLRLDEPLMQPAAAATAVKPTRFELIAVTRPGSGRRYLATFAVALEQQPPWQHAIRFAVSHPPHFYNYTTATALRSWVPGVTILRGTAFTAQVTISGLSEFFLRIDVEAGTDAVGNATSISGVRLSPISTPACSTSNSGQALHCTEAAGSGAASEPLLVNVVTVMAAVAPSGTAPGSPPPAPADAGGASAVSRVLVSLRITSSDGHDILDMALRAAAAAGRPPPQGLAALTNGSKLWLEENPESPDEITPAPPLFTNAPPLLEPAREPTGFFELQYYGAPHVGWLICVVYFPLLGVLTIYCKLRDTFSPRVSHRPSGWCSCLLRWSLLLGTLMPCTYKCWAVHLALLFATLHLHYASIELLVLFWNPQFAGGQLVVATVVGFVAAVFVAFLRPGLAYFFFRCEFVRAPRQRGQEFKYNDDGCGAIDDTQCNSDATGADLNRAQQLAFAENGGISDAAGDDGLLAGSPAGPRGPTLRPLIKRVRRFRNGGFFIIIIAFTISMVVHYVTAITMTDEQDRTAQLAMGFAVAFTTFLCDAVVAALAVLHRRCFKESCLPRHFLHPVDGDAVAALVAHRPDDIGHRSAAGGAASPIFAMERGLWRAAQHFDLL